MNTEMAIKDNIYLSFPVKEFIFSKNNNLDIILSKNTLAKDYSLIIDIYDLDNPIHPEGHLGWWKFDLSEVYDNSVQIELIIDEQLSVMLNNTLPVDKWENRKLSANKFEINAVIRDSITNGIAYIEKIPAFRTDEEALNFRKIDSVVLANESFSTSANLFPQNSKIHIVSHNLFTGDAVGNLCLSVYQMLKQNQISVELYAEQFDLSMNDIVNRVSELTCKASKNDKILYFYSIYDPYLDTILQVEVKEKLVYYHGITEPDLLQVFDPELSVVCKRGYAQLPKLRDFDSYLSNSKASAEVLLEYLNKNLIDDSLLNSPEFTLNDIDFSEVKEFNVQDSTITLKLNEDENEEEPLTLCDINIVSPKLFSSKELNNKQAQKFSYGESSGKVSGARLLYVGRMKSHKKIEDILSLFASYLKLDKSAKLWLIGGGSDKAYSDYLNWVQHSQLILPEGSVEWFGHVDDKELQLRYEQADSYISMSEHEGFCLPLLEAMMVGTPVFAYSISAVKEVLGESGGCFSEKNFEHLAAHIHRILSDKKKVADISQRQLKRANELLEDMNGKGFLNVIMP